MKEVGGYVGKFLPPHAGHLSVIDRALRECKKVVVVLAEDPARSRKMCKKSGFPYFSPQKRLEWLKKHYKNNKNVKFVFLDESGLEKFPKGLKEWSARFKRVVKENLTAKYADESYRELNERYFPECEFVSVDRDKIKVHGTDIRNDRSYLKYVIPEGYEEIKNEIEKGENYYE